MWSFGRSRLKKLWSSAPEVCGEMPEGNIDAVKNVRFSTQSVSAIKIWQKNIWGREQMGKAGSDRRDAGANT